MNIYFNEYNLLMGSGGVSYLPFVSGILSAYIKSDLLLASKVEVQPFIFVPDTVENIIALYEKKPDVAAFSIAMWNEQLSLKVASQIKEQWPSCKIVFGGASTPHDSREYMKKNSFIDFCIRAEGEIPFKKLISRLAINEREFADVPHLSWRSSDDQIIVNKETIPFNRSLDEFPSPYLTGEFDYLLQPGHKQQAIIETNRGCPFLCTFCYWGKGGSTTKYRFRSLETVYAELEYLASKKVEYIFNADSNFGMHKRDFDIAKKLVELKKSYGYPEKFRTCWGKNTSERIFKIASLLQYHGLDKGVTLARQSNSKDVLKNIKRTNIKLSTYKLLEERFNKLQVPVYGELILGLPGETLESWKAGIQHMLDTGVNNQLFVYQAEVYPNTELGSPAYQKQHGIKTQKIKLNEIHCSPRKAGWIDEFQEIIVETNTISREDYRSMNKFAIWVMLIHSMKLALYPFVFANEHLGISYTNFVSRLIDTKTGIIGSFNEAIDAYIDGLLRGEGRGIYNPDVSDVYLEIEEVLFVAATERAPDLLDEIDDLIGQDIESVVIRAFWSELLQYQVLAIPKFAEERHTLSHRFYTSVPDYCSHLFLPEVVDIVVGESSSEVTFEQPGYVDRIEFAKKQIVWARKSGTILLKSDRELGVLDANRKAYVVDDFDSEKTLKVTLFDKDELESFEKFKAI